MGEIDAPVGRVRNAKPCVREARAHDVVAMLRGLDKRISQKTKLPVHVADDPLRAVVRGTGMALKNLKNFKFLMT